MGRHSHSQTLNRWANGEYVGHCTVNAAGHSELQYDAGWCVSPRNRPILLSLPFNLRNEPLKGALVFQYFDGLLPDSDSIRRRVVARFKTGPIDAFDLLAASADPALAHCRSCRMGICPKVLTPWTARWSMMRPSSRSNPQ